MSANRCLFPYLLGPALAVIACTDSDTHGASSTGTIETTGPITATGDGGTTLSFECIPGQLRCAADATALEKCAPTGRAWFPEPCPSQTQCVPCDPEHDDCEAEVRCLGPCSSADELPSSAGCSFIANRQLHIDEEAPDGLIVGNPNSDTVASLWLYQVTEGDKREELLEGPILLDPLEAHTFELTTNFIMGNGSLYRNGGNYHLVSDIPVIAYHHAPYRINRGNDSSMLLPEAALRGDYVVPSYAPHAEQHEGVGLPSYFEVVALQDYTRLEWYPPVDTAGNGLPIPFVAAGGVGSLPMNRFDDIRIAASNSNEPNPDLRDVSGTIVHADKPIWVVGASRCSRVPVRDEPALGRCDPLQELAIPLAYWGNRYVAPASPDRCSHDEPPVCGDERHYWRVYNGDINSITVEVLPETVELVPASPGQTFANNHVTLAKRGDWVEFSVAHGTHLVMEGDGAFLPVEYLQSGRSSGEPTTEASPLGDPAMVQMIPVDEWLSRYVFVTGSGFGDNYVQVIRHIGDAGVFLDGALVSTYEPVGDYAVATVLIDEGTHLIESSSNFGIIQVGYSDAENLECPDSEGVPHRCLSSYAYPGGMKSLEIYIP